jgi:hypothetical protein
VREIEKGCKVANARCSSRRDHLAPFFFSMFCIRIFYKINCTCFRRSDRNEQRSTLTPMVEFAVFTAIGLFGLSRFCCWACPFHTHTKFQSHTNQISPRQPYLQGTRPFGRSYYNVHSYSYKKILYRSSHCTVR